MKIIKVIWENETSSLGFFNNSHKEISRLTNLIEEKISFSKYEKLDWEDKVYINELLDEIKKTNDGILSRYESHLRIEDNGFCDRN